MKKVLLPLLAVCALLLLASCTHTHAFGEWTVAKAATCTEPGTMEQTCACGEKQTKTIPATGHSFGNWTTTKAATCTEGGTRTCTCSKCGQAKTEVVAASHNWKNATCTSPKTCTVCGKKEGSATGHRFTNVDGVCANCGLNYYTVVAMIAMKDVLHEKLRSPESLQLSSVDYYFWENDKHYYYINIHYSAENRFGGRDRSSSGIYLHIFDNGGYEYGRGGDVQKYMEEYLPPIADTDVDKYMEYYNS